ncbi:hypothetical protein VN23_14985 [Janthinobacterium sp. B9-8]|nr:hypothetical protein VN23_14985 [Janthinobacterium sp. B9-8]
MGEYTPPNQTQILNHGGKENTEEHGEKQNFCNKASVEEISKWRVIKVFSMKLRVLCVLRVLRFGFPLRNIRS